MFTDDCYFADGKIFDKKSGTCVAEVLTAPIWYENDDESNESDVYDGIDLNIPDGYQIVFRAAKNNKLVTQCSPDTVDVDYQEKTV